MRRLALAIAFVGVLSGAMARAGEIHTTGAVATPTPGSMTNGGPRGAGITGDIDSVGATASEASNLSLTIVLTLISIVQ